MIRGAAHVGQLDHLGDVAARDPLGDDHDQLDPVLDRLEDGVLGEGGGDGDDRAVDRAAVVLDRLGDGVEDRHAVDLAALAAGGDAADDLGAVVEALAGQVDRLAAGDPLDDEGRVLVESRMLIGGRPLDLGDGAAGGLPHRDRAVAVLDPVARRGS